MKSLVIVLALVVLTGCKQEPAKLDSGLAGYDPHLVDTARAACLKKGGRFGAGGLRERFLCYENTRDGNKSCTVKPAIARGCAWRGRRPVRRSSHCSAATRC